MREPLREPWAGELDVEATLDNVLGKAFPEPGDWIAQRRVDRRHQVVLMVDTSLSMSGENMAIAAVAAAVLALKLHPEDLSVVVFEDKANAVTHLGRARTRREEVVRRMLDQPVRGYTNIEAALALGAAELERGRNPRRSGLLITDGVVDRRRRPAAARAPLPAALRPAHRGLQDEPGALPASWPTPATATCSRCAPSATCRRACSTSPTASCGRLAVRAARARLVRP